MATILDKDLQRECTVLANERNIMVTLGSDQTIKFKLKGMKSGEVSIGIEELWNQLNGINKIDHEANKTKSTIIENDDDEDIEMKSSKDNPMIPLYDIRSRFCTSLTSDMLSKVDPILSEFVAEHKKKLKDDELNKKKRK